MKKKIFILLFLLIMSCRLIAWEKDSVSNIARFAYNNLSSDIQSQINKDKYFEGVNDMQDGKHKDIFKWGFVFHPVDNFGDCPDGIQNLTSQAIAESDITKRSYILGGLTGYITYISHPLHTAQSERETKSVHLLIDRTSEAIVRNAVPVVNIESQPITDVKKFAQDIAVEANRDYERMLDVYTDKEQLKEITESAVNRAVKKSNELIILCVKEHQPIGVSAIADQSGEQSSTAVVPVPGSDIDERVNAAKKASEEARSLREKLFQEEAQQSLIPGSEQPIKKQEVPEQGKVVVSSPTIQRPQEPKNKNQADNNQSTRVSTAKPISVISNKEQSQLSTVSSEKNNSGQQPVFVQPVISQSSESQYPRQNPSSEFALLSQQPSEDSSQRKQTSVVVSKNAFSQPLVENAHPYINWDEPHKIIKDRIVSCYDGDTVTTSKGIKIRLIGIDTPEIKPLQPGAIEAKEFTERFCRDKEVSMVVQKDKDKDKYNRTLAIIFVGNKCLNFELIKSGKAKVRYVDGYYKASSRLLNLDKWRPDYVPPKIDVSEQAETLVFSGKILPPPSFFDLEKTQQSNIGQFTQASHTNLTPPSEIEKSEIYTVVVPTPQEVNKQSPRENQIVQQGQTPLVVKQDKQQVNSDATSGSVIPMIPFVLYQPRGAVLNPNREYVIRFVSDGNGRYYMDVSEK